MGGSLVAVVVVVLLVVEAAVLEGLVPFLVPVTNSICGNKNSTSERQRKCFRQQFNHRLVTVGKTSFALLKFYRAGDKWSRDNCHDHSGLRSGSLRVQLLAARCY